MLPPKCGIYRSVSLFWFTQLRTELRFSGTLTNILPTELSSVHRSKHRNILYFALKLSLRRLRKVDHEFKTSWTWEQNQSGLQSEFQNS